MKEPIKIILADDSQLFRVSMKAMLDGEENIKVVGEACNGKDLLTLLDRQRCDIVLLDINMKEMNGIEATPKIKEKFPKVKIIIMSIYDEDALIVKLMRRGADSYLSKDSASSADLLNAIREVHKNGGYHTPRVVNALSANFAKWDHANSLMAAKNNITPQEIKALKLLFEEKRDEEIAENLSVSVDGVKWYWKSLFRKTGTKSRLSLILFAIKHHLLDN